MFVILDIGGRHSRLKTGCSRFEGLYYEKQFRRAELSGKSAGLIK